MCVTFLLPPGIKGLIDHNEIVPTKQDTPHVLNTFFPIIINNFKIPEHADNGPIANNKSDPILKITVRYRNHPSILTIAEVCKESQIFSFSF